MTRGRQHTEWPQRSRAPRLAGGACPADACQHVHAGDGAWVGACMFGCVRASHARVHARAWARAFRGCAHELRAEKLKGLGADCGRLAKVTDDRRDRGLRLAQFAKPAAAHDARKNLLQRHLLEAAVTANPIISAPLAHGSNIRTYG